MIDLKDKVVLVTGNRGFFGKHISKALNDRGATVAGCNREHYNLLNGDPDNAYYLLHDTKPYCIINLMADTGGIVYNRLYPADIFYNNTMMNLNLLYTAQAFSKKFGIEKVLSILTSCSYPDNGQELLSEGQFYDGLPNESVQGFGLAKRNIEAYSRFLNKQYGFPAYTCAVTNLFGEHDSFNLQRAKVLSSLVRKFVEAKQLAKPTVECLGTGSPRREFLYAPVAAELVCQALEKYDDPTLPLNIGSGEDISIKDLAEKIKYLVGYEGRIEWKIAAGDGQMKKLLDVSRMKNILDYKPFSFDEAVLRTIRWYENNQTLANEGR